MSRRLVVLFAVACGAAVANIYYAQPLLHGIAGALGVGTGATAAVVTASQVGYATGLAFVVPLGDRVERRRLVVSLTLACAAALAVCAAAPSLTVLAAAAVAVGVTSVVVQVLVPLAGDLAADDERGRVVGSVMSGLLIGILAARTVSGLIADAGGWRAVYVVAALLMLGLAVALWAALPRLERSTSQPYGALLRSIVALVREEPVLWLRIGYGVLGLFAFSLLWTALTLVLSAGPFHYGEGTIGLFGLAGLGGAAAAQGAGRLADRGYARAATAGFWLLVLAGWGLCALVHTSLVALVCGLVVLDAGIQGAHITNQSIIYSLRPGARSRLTTAYITSQFAAAAVGSAIAPVAWDAGGWALVCAIGAAAPALALVLWAATFRGTGRQPVTGGPLGRPGLGAERPAGAVTRRT